MPRQLRNTAPSLWRCNFISSNFSLHIVVEQRERKYAVGNGNRDFPGLLVFLRALTLRLVTAPKKLRAAEASLRGTVNWTKAGKREKNTDIFCHKTNKMSDLFSSKRLEDLWSAFSADFLRIVPVALYFTTKEIWYWGQKASWRKAKIPQFIQQESNFRRFAAGLSASF